MLSTERMLPGAVLLWALLACNAAEEPQNDWKNLNLPPDFQRKLENRRRMDLFQATNYASEAPGLAIPEQPRRRRSRERVGTIRTIISPALPEMAAFTNSFPEKFAPLRGYRAPIAGVDPEKGWPVKLSENEGAEVVRAAQVVEERLAYDGLLRTLVKVAGAMQPNFPTGEQEAEGVLRKAGFPVDLLKFYTIPTEGSSKDERILKVLLEGIRAGRKWEDLESDLGKAVFRFVPTAPGFEAVLENGQEPLRLLRLQVGGGFERGGLVAGASIDVVDQLIEAVPEAKLIASVTEEFFPPLKHHAGVSWVLRQPNHLTLISEPLPVSAWAQDNGKGGTIRSKEGRKKGAVLAPRYASMGEGRSLLVAGESYLMRGVKEAGLEVRQSPLLFQGGNVSMIGEAGGKRTLLISEAEVHRNQTLGLRSNEVVKAFGAEFGANEVMVLPTGSYHLDYDVSVRWQEGRNVAFINDPQAAAELVVKTGLQALVKHGLFSPEEAEKVEGELAKGRKAEAAKIVRDKIEGMRNEKGEFKAEFMSWFRGALMDSPAANLRTFCLGLDLLESKGPGRSELAEYFEALRSFEQVFRRQRELLEARGWTVIAVPSMPDVSPGINYLNGVHGPDRFLMPAYGGLYAPVDRAAEALFEQALGGKVRVIPIQCADSQRKFGAVHCMVSVVPAE